MSTVVITEKPDAMEKIAHSLSASPKRVSGRHYHWYELSRGRQKVIVTCAVGHLFALDASKKSGWTYPIFDAEWVPTYTRKGSEFTKKYFETLSQAIRKGDKFIVATDFDTEGEVIGYNILRFLAGRTDAKRMKFSAMTNDELVESFETALPTIYSEQVEAGLARHYLDFFWGINLTRALTLAIKNSGAKVFAILSTGRVQGPTLAMLYEREQEIKNFKPARFWQIAARLMLDGKEVHAQYEEERIWEKDNADRILEESTGKNAVVKSTDKRNYRQPPPVPFNTTDLQAEAYSQFKYSPTQTLSLAESLYQAGYISYPRSSSQKLPPNINYSKIMQSLSRLRPYMQSAKALLAKGRIVPAEGRRDDPAHPAIYPTFETPSLSSLTSQQRKLYDLIVRRFMSAFAGDAVRESNTVTLDVGGNIFIVIGKRTTDAGWTEFYAPYVSMEELVLPKLNVGDEVEVLGIEHLAKETQPPTRYSQGSILKEMERRNLGTRATRADILRTLYDREYITGKSIMVTRLGEAVVNALKEYSPRILSEELTTRFEKEAEQMLGGKVNREQVVDDAKEALSEILEEFKKNEKKIGEKLAEGLQEARREERRLGKCLNCNTGDLSILFSRKTGKRFVGCSNYKNCGTGFPLPARGGIKPSSKPCESCGWPVVQLWRGRPFKMCVYPGCKSKAGWNKTYKPTKA